MSNIRHYSFGTDGRAHESKLSGEMMFLKKNILSQYEDFQDECSDVDRLLHQALTSDHYSVFLVGPSDVTKTNQRGDTVSQYMLNVVNYSNPNEPTSEFIKMNTYVTASGLPNGYNLSSKPVDFYRFNEDLQEKYREVVRTLESENKSYDSSSQDLSSDDSQEPPSPRSL
jgi:hypothetical protein